MSTGLTLPLSAWYIPTAEGHSLIYTAVLGVLKARSTHEHSHLVKNFLPFPTHQFDKCPSKAPRA